MIASVVLYDFRGGAWMTLPLAWVIERACTGVWHVGWSIRFHEYSPGLASSILMWMNLYFVVRYHPPDEDILPNVWIPALLIGGAFTAFLSISCDRKSLSGKHAHAFVATLNTPIEKMEFVDKGESESGFAIERKIVTKEGITPSDGTKKDRTFVDEMLVTQFVEGPLDPALFTIPTGFRQVEHIDRNPPANVPNQWSMPWDHFKASVARLFR